MKKFIIFLVTAAMMICCIPFANVSAAEIPELKEYGMVDCGSVKIEYGIYGDMNAQPLVLLPCNGNDMHNFDDSVLPELSKHYKVITISPRGTGKSGYIEEEGLSFELMSADLLKVLDYLKIEKTRIFGFSDGGNLGLVFTVNNPDRVHSLAIMGANINPFGTKTFTQIGIIFEWLGLYLKAEFTGETNDKLRRDIQGLMVFHPTLTFDDLKTIKVPVLNIYGENDMMKRTHSKRITASINGAQELMVKGGGHSSCFDYTETIINPALLEFFDSETETTHTPTTPKECVDYFNTTINRVKTDAKSITQNHVTHYLVATPTIPSVLSGIYKMLGGDSWLDGMLRDQSTGAETFTTKADIQAKFPVEGKTWASKLTADDVKSATCTKSNGVYTITIVTKADGKSSTIDYGQGHAPKALNAVPPRVINDNIPGIASGITGTATMDYPYGKVVITVDAATGNVKTAEYDVQWTINFDDIGAIIPLGTKSTYIINW